MVRGRSAASARRAESERHQPCCPNSLTASKGGRRAAIAALPLAAGRRSMAAVLAVAALMGVLLGRFVTAGSDGPSIATAPAAAGRSSVARVASLQARLAVHPDDPVALTDLAVAYLGRARDTADPSYYPKAAQAVERSLALDPSSPTTMTAAGLLALGRHDFAAALDWGLDAHAASPDSADPLGVMVDAYVGVGRYPEAVDAAQRMVDRRPSLAGLARVSYLRELHGDRPGAIAAMRQAITAGAGDAADVATVEVLLGDLLLGSGDLVAARRAYERSLERVPTLGSGEVGLARTAAAEGDLAGAVARLEPVARRLPLASSIALLGDLYAGMGRADEAEAQYDLVRVIEKLNRTEGVAVDLELARFEADRGTAGAVALARAALAARPNVYAEDALGWALRQTGQAAEALPHMQAAVRLGTADAQLWYHLAAVEADLGLVEDARLHLRKAFGLSPTLTVGDLPAAKALADALGVLR
ncbi:MAG: tetratricopeptide repeat protein [Acidimicrobiales bacterium]